MSELDQNYSTARLTGNLALWLVMLGAAGGASEWLLRRYQPRLRWSLRTMLAGVGLVALVCSWFAVLRDRANLQDPVVAIRDNDVNRTHLYLDRWGPDWLDLVGADRFRRRIVGAHVTYDVNYYDDDEEALFELLARLPSLQYLNLTSWDPTPGTVAALGGMSQLRTLRINDIDDTGDEARWRECFAAVGKLDQLEELHLEGTIARDCLAHLGGLTNLKSLSLEIDWYAGEQESDELGDDGWMFPLACLPALPRLEAIDLRDFSYDATLGDNDLRHLTVLPRLKSLNLSDVDVVDEGLAALVSLKSLEELAIADDTVTTARLQSLRALTRVKALHIERYAAVTDAGLAELPSLKSLEERKIAGDAISQAGVQLLHAFKRLKALRIDQFGSYDQSDRMTTLMLDQGDAIFILESEVEGFRHVLDALRQSNPGIVIDSDPKWFDDRRRRKSPRSGQGFF